MLLPTQVDNESMSDGDESDDVDLTDVSSYGSDVSEWNEGTLFNDAVSWPASPNPLKMPLRLLKILSHIATLMCQGIMAFRSASLLPGLVPRSSSFG